MSKNFRWQLRGMMLGVFIALCAAAMATVPMQDCNQNLIDDLLDIATSPTLDCNNNGMIDLCEIIDGGGAPLVEAGESCEDAGSVCPGVTYTGSTIGRDSNPGSVSVCGETSSPDVWYKYQPSVNGNASVSLCGSGFDTLLYVYSDCPADAFVACSDDSACGFQSETDFSVTGGVTYYIQIAGWGQAAGTYNLTIEGPPCVAEPITAAVGGSLDCNRNGILDECEVLEDCNNNGIADVCELLAPYSADSGTLEPLQGNVPTSFSLVMAPPAFGMVKIKTTANGDLDFFDEYLELFLNATPIGIVFDSFYSQCANLTEDVIITAQQWNSLISGGLDEITVLPSPSVESSECPPVITPTPPPPYNFAEIEVTYNVQNDWNCNGILDECEITSGTVFDCNLNGIPDEYDLFFDVASMAQAQDLCEDSESIVHNMDYEGTFLGSTPDGFSSCDDIFTDASLPLSAANVEHNDESIILRPVKQTIQSEEGPGGFPNSNDVWYNYVPCTTGTATLQICGNSQSLNGIVLSVHEGCPGTTDNEVACIFTFGDCRQLTFDVSACTTYTIRIAEASTIQPGGATEGADPGPDFILTLLDGPLAKIPGEFKDRAVDTTPPIIVCPDDVVADSDLTTCGADLQIPQPEVIEDCAIKEIFNDYTGTDDASGFYPVGVTEVLWTVVNAADMVSTCTMTVTVNDTVPPMITCPPDITVGNDPGECGAQMLLIAPEVSDNCAIIEVFNDLPRRAQSEGGVGIFFPVGETELIWTVIDSSDNETTCSQIITVLDTEPPLLLCPEDIVTTATLPGCEAFVELGQPEFGDNCPGATLTNSFNGMEDASGIYPAGDTVVIWTATDASDNVTTCATTVSVVCVIECSLTPTDEVKDAGGSHMVTATILLNDLPTTGITVNFEVTSGPNTGESDTSVTNDDGQTTFTYISNGMGGTDTIVASGMVGNLPFSCEATITWREIATPTPTPTPSPTPCFTGEWTFEGSDDGWTTGGASLVFPLPAFGTTSSALTVAGQEFFSFGFWQSPSAAIPSADSSLVYAIVYTLRWDGVTCEQPQIRLRAIGSRFGQLEVMGIDSRGDCAYGPEATERDYVMHVLPQGGGIGDDFIVALDILNFDPFDSSADTIHIENVAIYCFPFDSLDPSLQVSYTFTGSAEGWTTGTAQLLNAPTYAETGTSLMMTSTDNALNFGYWHSPNGAVSSTPGQSLLIQYDVTADSAPITDSAAIRVRTITDDSQGFRYMELPPASLLDGSEGVAATETYSLIYDPPAITANGLALSFDLINFNPNAAQNFNAELNQADVFDVELPTFP